MGGKLAANQVMSQYSHSDGFIWFQVGLPPGRT